MAGDFVPFLSSVRSKLEKTPAGFTPAVAPSSTLPESSQDCPTPPHREIKVEVKRDGDRVSRICIQCRCGEVIELDCDY